MRGEGGREEGEAGAVGFEVEEEGVAVVCVGDGEEGEGGFEDNGGCQGGMFLVEVRD